MAGRRRRLSPQVQQAVVIALRTGATKRSAAQYAGLSETTFYEEVRRNPTFAAMVEEAEAHNKLQLVGRIKASAMSGDWKAASWLLERRHYDEWGPAPERPVVSVEVKSGIAAAIGGGDQSSLDTTTRVAQLASALDLLVRVGGAPDSLRSGTVARRVGASGPTEVDEVDTA